MSNALLPEIQWNAADYAANSAPQLAWARERIDGFKLRGDERILDVGCGDGKVSAELARAVPDGSVTGIDSSSPMIEFAREMFPRGGIPNLTFEVMDARRIRFARPFDLIFSNAALHWVDDHPAFLQGAAASLRPGGRLSVSCGGKGNAQEVFLAFRSEIRLKAWRGYFRKLTTPYFFHSPADYEKWLPRFGFEIQKVRLAPKDAVHEDTSRFAAWLRTTWLPYTQRVPQARRSEFIDSVACRYLEKHRPDSNGRVHVRMVRLEIDAVRL